jgi:hypothetical protein
VTGDLDKEDLRIYFISHCGNRIMGIYLCTRNLGMTPSVSQLRNHYRNPSTRLEL